jgi:hypothetical protein
MKVLRVYVDTSVLGGCFDAEFERWSTGLIEDFRQRRFLPVLSEVTAAEVLPAPDPVRDLYAEVLDLGAEVLSVTREALTLRASYQARGCWEAASRTTYSTVPSRPSRALMSSSAGISATSYASIRSVCSMPSTSSRDTKHSRSTHRRR